MASTFQRKVALRRKFHVLRTIASSKYVKKKGIFKDALTNIYKLKLQLEVLKKEVSELEEIRRQYLSSLIMKQLIQLPQKKEVKVEKAGKGFIIRVECEKGKDHKLIRILEAFEELGLVALQAKVSCNFCFALEAVVVAQEQEEKLPFPSSRVDVNCITQALIKAVEGEGGEKEGSTIEVP